MTRKRTVAPRPAPATVASPGQTERWVLCVGIGLDVVSGVLNTFHRPLGPLARPARLMVNVTEPKTPVGPAPNLGELAQAWQGARALAEAAGVPVPPHIARNALAAVQQATRQVRGLAPPAPRRKLTAIGNEPA